MASMDAPLIAMLVAIGIFLVLTIIGLVALIRRARTLVQNAESLQLKVNEQLTGLMAKQEEAMKRLAAVEAQSQEVSEGAARMMGEFDRLTTLLNELAIAQRRLRNPFSSLLES